MVAVLRGYVGGSGAQIHYRTCGEAGPDLVLLHESPLSSREFERVIPIIGGFCRVFAFDTPGYGLSDAPNATPTIGSYAKCFLQAIDNLGVDSFYVAGVHTGAAMALELAAYTSPKRVLGVVFSGLPLLTEQAKNAARHRIGRPSAREDGAHMVEIWANRRASWGETADLPQMMMGVRDLLLCYDLYPQAYEAIFSYDARSALTSLRCPSLFLNAEFDALAKSDAEVAGELGAKLKIVGGVMGQLPWRSPETYAEELAAFIGNNLDS